MYSDLIIGYDGSRSARDALALGRRLAEATGAKPTVVCVHPLAALSAAVPEPPATSMRASAERTLDEARAELSAMPGAVFRPVAETSPARALHAAAEEAEAALVVVGSTHRNVVGRVLAGTTAEQVVHAAPCAVAIAPAGYADREREHFGVVGAAVDGGDETERIARVAGRIARGAGTALRVISVTGSRDPEGQLYAGALGYRASMDASRELMTQALDRAASAAGGGLRVERTPLEGHAPDALVSQSHELDLLVLGSRGFGPLRRVVLGSVSSRVLWAAACPVLVIPRRTAEQLDELVGPLAEAAAR
jgi:nucleotide-binding universal stress UspA family protein